MEKDLKISELKQMQYKLFEANKEKWNDMEPKYAKDHMLYMNDEKIRSRFIEEMCDVMMYYVEVLNRLNITEEEFSEAYINKNHINLNRNFEEERKQKYI